MLRIALVFFVALFTDVTLGSMGIATPVNDLGELALAALAALFFVIGINRAEDEHNARIAPDNTTPPDH